jgi:hypothetical protein
MKLNVKAVIKQVGFNNEVFVKLCRLANTRFIRAEYNNKRREFIVFTEAGIFDAQFDDDTAVTIFADPDSSLGKNLTASKMFQIGQVENDFLHSYYISMKKLLEVP